LVTRAREDEMREAYPASYEAHLRRRVKELERENEGLRADREVQAHSRQTLINENKRLREALESCAKAYEELREKA
jgi:hypothetical protein